MKRHLYCVFAFLSLSFIPMFTSTTCVRAEEGPSSRNSAYEAVLADSGYGLGVLGGYGVEVGDPPELDIAQVMPFISFPLSGPVGKGIFRGVPEYKVEAVIGYVDNFDQRGQVGINPVGLRYNLTAAGGRVVPFVEGVLGVAYLNVPKKVQGTRFSFTEGIGAGVRVFVSDGFALEVSGRYRHLSNAGIRKPNPGINTAFILVGFSYY
jgi:hypothetical protein